MYVVFIDVHCFNPERRVFLCGTVQDFLEFDEYIGLQYLPAVLCAPDDMVLVLVGGVVQGTNPHGTQRTTAVNIAAKTGPRPPKEEGAHVPRMIRAGFLYTRGPRQCVVAVN